MPVVAAVALVLLAAGCVQGTTRVSRSTDGVQGNAASGGPAISDNGRFVAFGSAATNLVAGDTNGVADVFVRDRKSGTTTRVSVSSGGGQGNASSGGPAISGDGRYVAFGSSASNLVAGDANGTFDVFVHDRQTGTTTLEGSGGGSPDLDDTGSFLAYNSGGKVRVRDRQAGTTEVIPSGTQGGASPDLSGDGRFVAFFIDGDDGDDGPDVWLYDRDRQLLDRVSYSGDNNYEAEVSDDGQTVVFGNGGNDQALVWQSGRIRDVRGGPSYSPDVSDDGRFVTYGTESDLDDRDTNGSRRDAYLLDLFTDEVTYLSVGPGGQGANGESFGPAISGDGRIVAFESRATNLVDGDTNGLEDVFVHDSGAERTSSAG